MNLSWYYISFFIIAFSFSLLPHAADRQSDISDRDVLPTSMAIMQVQGGSGTGSGCPPNYTGPEQLVGLQVVDSHFETPGLISSDQVIEGNISVEYDSGSSIELLPGFEVKLGVEFEAYIDGCVPE